MKRRRGGRHTIIGRRPSERDLSLAEIIFPLRYDIVAQEETLRLAGAEKFSVQEIVDSTNGKLPFLRIWVAHERQRAWGYAESINDTRHARQARRYHRGNTKKLVKLYRSIKKRGYVPGEGQFSLKYPVDDALTTEGHKVPPDSFFLTNGQHRLATLWGMSYRTMPKEWYFITEVKGLRVPEYTYGFIKMGHLDEKGFCDFARLRFANLPLNVDNARALYDWARDTGQPDWLAYYVERYWFDD